MLSSFESLWGSSKSCCKSNEWGGVGWMRGWIALWRKVFCLAFIPVTCVWSILWEWNEKLTQCWSRKKDIINIPWVNLKLYAIMFYQVPVLMTVSELQILYNSALLSLSEDTMLLYYFSSTEMANYPLHCDSTSISLWPVGDEDNYKFQESVISKPHGSSSCWRLRKWLQFYFSAGNMTWSSLGSKTKFSLAYWAENHQLYYTERLKKKLYVRKCMMELRPVEQRLAWKRVVTSALHAKLPKDKVI